MGEFQKESIYSAICMHLFRRTDGILYLPSFYHINRLLLIPDLPRILTLDFSNQF